MQIREIICSRTAPTPFGPYSRRRGPPGFFLVPTRPHRPLPKVRSSRRYATALGSTDGAQGSTANHGVVSSRYFLPEDLFLSVTSCSTDYTTSACCITEFDIAFSVIRRCRHKGSTVGRYLHPASLILASLTAVPKHGPWCGDGAGDALYGALSRMEEQG